MDCHCGHSTMSLTSSLILMTVVLVLVGLALWKKSREPELNEMQRATKIWKDQRRRVDDYAGGDGGGGCC